MSHITHILAILLLTTLVKGTPLGCELLHRVIGGCPGEGGSTIENCINEGMGPLDLLHEINVQEFNKRVQGSVSNQEAYNMYLEAIGSICARGGEAATLVHGFQSTVECDFNFAKVMAKAIGCLY